ncbi:MAG: hypothetical protein HY301_16845, partial [Verrucomicrobia bacterium]|nr:hypothetical protein [Verrucomicrobiota bacterium]
HFIGKRLSKSWTPPPVEISGKSYKPQDFVGWSLSAHVISERAKDALLPVVSEFAEFRLMMEFKRKRYFCMNVYFTADCLDFTASGVLFSPDDPKRILNISTYAFRREAIPDAPIFKEKNHPGEIFVRQPFIECVRKNQLTGAALLDPAVNPFYFILRGDRVDAAEGFNIKKP